MLLRQLEQKCDQCRQSCKLVHEPQSQSRSSRRSYNRSKNGHSKSRRCREQFYPSELQSTKSSTSQCPCKALPRRPFAPQKEDMKEETEALSAIYGEDYVLEQDYEDDWMNHGDDNLVGCDVSSDAQAKQLLMPTFSITIRADNVECENEFLKEGSNPRSHFEARLIISFQPGYPTSEPPIYQLSIPWMRGGQKQVIANALEELYLEHLGESIVYIWVEKLRELLHQELATRISAASGEDESAWNKSKVDPSENTSMVPPVAMDSVSSDELIDRFANSLHVWNDGIQPHSKYNPAESTSSTQAHTAIHTGAPFTDRKSTFQAHVAPVTEVSQIRTVLEQLYQNKKVSTATHNMYAYRILREDSKTWLQDCDDDGETHAGSRLLHLLQILNCKNVMVVVSRWYGGIQLHADRFKHINNVARQALQEFGFVFSTDGKKMDEAKIKKGSTKR